MSRINVNNLTFYYDGDYEPVFDQVSFAIDTDWKLGFIGRNGKGKTTFLKLLMAKYDYTGTISTNVVFDYFPYTIKEEYDQKPAAEFLEELKAGCEEWRVICELDQLGVEAERLYRPFGTLSFGERTKIMLALLFSGEHQFLLIDEPTNHLDQASREMVKGYLAGKRGFILVSHDRELLDACIDHVLVLNRHSIEVQAGSFSSWWENKCRRDAFEKRENEKHKKEINKLKNASERARQWASKNEASKIGIDPIKDHDRGNGTRPYIGAKTKKMQSRVTQMEKRMQREIEEKEDLLWDIENPPDLKLMPLQHHKNTLLSMQKYGLQYSDARQPLFQNLTMEIKRGERVFLNGYNGCGKSSLISMILQQAVGKAEGLKADPQKMLESGTLETASGLIISYISQDTSFLSGSIHRFCQEKQLDESLFCSILRQLDLERVQFDRQMEHYSEGQKKKVLIAASLLTPAHLYIWDEPLNYIDIFSRMQIEKLILASQPTMLVVEHDVRFREQIATKVIDLGC
ncbi:MAG: ABC-F family ATP-binding cassette domain-containing protein [Lachnospiraceae bacterium]|nr:ABC-F family ATP-binding cassette domain-containing protein [Lachnospiraceae bacterium]